MVKSCEKKKKTGRLLVIDGGWQTCGLSSEIFATVLENIPINKLKSNPRRLTLQNSPAPTASNLEKIYYPDLAMVKQTIIKMIIK